ncbi:hypothetical protein BJX61DRAFT_283710 [Aspergillus egyptiacus]|nr:hypothetical protein BJX61DRAFT_283710 [Aspergillus egyptiacus]
MPPLVNSSLSDIPRSVPVPGPGNVTDIGVEVVCAWPVSGQYGPGTRVLYYVLVAACVFARKEEWLRNACLAAALIFPAIAALHGIVLATVHVDGAVDMDVYGAFQLCSIGILTAPLTVRMSGTYFKDPRRNIIFLWTGLVLAGLLSITVELFRVSPSTCTHDDSGNPISPVVSNFPYSNVTRTTCNLHCSIEEGPSSPLRGGSANEIYVVPSPYKLTFGTVTLLAAACCVPAIVSLFHFWFLILQETWNKHLGRNGEANRPNRPDEVIEGTNGATVGKMLQINGIVRTVLSTVEVPVFAAAVLAILALGEMNFFSDPVDYGTEPIASIGQWAPIVGAALAVLGSLYLFLTEDDTTQQGCACSQSSERQEAGSLDPQSTPTTGIGQTATQIPSTSSLQTRNTAPTRRISDPGYRIWIGEVLRRAGTSVSNAAFVRLNDYQFKQDGGAFPEVPGEGNRNAELPQTRRKWQNNPNIDSTLTLARQSSNLTAGSSIDSELSSTTSGGIPPSSSRQSTRPMPPSPSSLSASHQAGAERSSSKLNAPLLPPSPAADPPLGRRRSRQNTLEVPPHLTSIRRNHSISSVSSYGSTVPGGPTTPTIVVSDDQGPSASLPVEYRHTAARLSTSTMPNVDSPLPLQHHRRCTS